MTGYRVDRARLEAYSTEEILRILKEERNDYTPEALRTFDEILADRGVTRERLGSAKYPEKSAAEPAPPHPDPAVMVRTTRDAVRVLNTLLGGVLNGSIDPEVAQVAANVVLAILRALEQQFMTDSGDEAGCNVGR